MFQTQKYKYGVQHGQLNGNSYLANFSSSFDQSASSKASFLYARPRTRGKGKPQETKLNRRQTDENITNNVAHAYPPEQTKEEVAKRLSHHHVDPNIAYVPHSARKSDGERHVLHSQSPQQTAAAKNNYESVAISNNAKTLQQNNNTSAGVIEETIHLPR